MKYTKLWVLTVLALLCLAVSAMAAETSFFAVGNNAWGATNMYAVVPPVGGKSAVVRTLAVSCDLAPGRIVVYTNGMPAQLTQDAGTGLTNYHVTSGTGVYGTNGFASADQVVLWNQGATPSVWRARVAAVSTTNITIYPGTVPPWSTIPAGTMLYRQGTNQVIIGVTNGATSLYNSFVTVGAIGEPVVIDMITAAVGGVNVVSGTYE